MKPTHRLFAAVLLAALAVSAAATRADPGDDAPPARGSSKEALELLSAAIRAQGPEEVAKAGAIRDLVFRIQSEIYDHAKDPPEKVSLGVSRRLTLDPERFRTEFKTSAGTDVYGYDATQPEVRRAWFAEYTPEGSLADVDGNPRFLVGDVHKADVRRIREQIDETKYLLRFFFLANLRGPEVVFERRSDETVEVFGKKVETKVLHRENHAEDANEPALTLWFDAKSLALVKAVVSARRAGERTHIFTYRYDERIQPRVKGVLFPFKIETREQSFGDDEIRLTSRSTVLENGIEFNADLDPALFRMPRR